MHKIKIEGKFPSLNQYTNSNRYNRYAGNNMKRKWTELCCYEAKSQCKKKYGKVKLKFNWHESNRRRDKDNIAFNKKFILDGLVEAGVIDNDNWKCVESFEDNFQVDKKWQGCVVEIEETI